MNEQTTPRLTVALDAAERYFATRLRADLWREASESDKTNALTQASFLISGAFSFYDAAFALDESTGEVVWNARVVAAVCEEALWLLRVDPTEYPEALTLGLAEAGAGGVGEVRPKFRRANGLRGVENARRRTRRLPRFERTRNGESDAVRLLKARNS